MAPLHGVVRDHPVDQHHAGELDQHRRQAQRQVGQPAALDGAEQRQREHLGRHRQRGRREHRAQGQHGPVHQEAGQPRPRRGHPPDAVEDLLDAVEGDQQRRHQRDEAGRGELADTGRELPQVALGRARGRGHEIGEHVIAERLAPAVEHGERRQHPEHHDRQRHQREHGGVGQRAGRLEQAVVEETVPQETGETGPAPAVTDPFHP